MTEEQTLIREMSSGYQWIMYKNGDRTLKKDESTWSDVTRAVGHLTNRIAELEKELLLERQKCEREHMMIVAGLEANVETRAVALAAEKVDEVRKKVLAEVREKVETHKINTAGRSNAYKENNEQLWYDKGQNDEVKRVLDLLKSLEGETV